MYNASDSILFMTSARQAVKNIIGLSESADPKNIAKMQNFVMNEATDYQVMSLMMTGEIPEQRYNLEEEFELFDYFRDTVLENFQMFTEAHGIEIAKSLVSEVGPVSQFGIDTAVPVLTHLYESGAIDILTEKKKKAAAKAGKGTKAGKTAAKGTEAAAKKQGWISKQAAAANKYIGYGKASRQPWHATQYGRMKKAWEAGKEVKKDTGFMPKAAVGDAALHAGKLAAPTIAVAAALYAGAKAYKAIFGKARAACKGAEDKAACLRQYKNKAVQAQIAAVKAGAAKCANSKNPEKCRAAIQKKVGKLQAKMG